MDCERGSELGLGISLDQLDEQWRADITGSTTVESAADDLLPWVFLLVVVLGMPALLSIAYLSKSKRVTAIENKTSIQ
jgi:hypothetical protein